MTEVGLWMRRRTIASALAILSASGAANAQTVLWGQAPTDQGQNNAPVYQVPQAPVYAPQQIIQTDPNAPIYYETVPRSPAPVYINPQPSYPAPVESAPPAWRIAPPAENLQNRGPTYEVISPAPLPSRQTDIAPPPPSVFTPEPRSQSSRPDAVREFASELEALITLAERYRAASPGFIEDLKELADKYETLPLEVVVTDPPKSSPKAQTDALFGGQDNETTVAAVPELDPEGEASQEPFETPIESEAPAQPEAQVIAEPNEAELPATSASEPEPEMVEMPADLPPTSAAIVYLRDDFADGDFVNGTTWAVRQGVWEVDPLFGLRAKFQRDPEPASITPSDLLQYLIGSETPINDAEPENNAALIEAQVSLGNAFSLVANITDHAGEGATHFIVHQGGANWLGYRLELRGGVRPLVVLTRRGASGYKDIMKVEAPGLTTGKSHQLRWARLSDGQMFVLIDGKPVITARDTVFQQGWTGVGYFIAGGDVSLRNIRIAEPVEQ